MSEPFRDELVPQRSLSPRGLTILMSLVAGISFIGGVVFFMIGAWPVVGFLGLDVLIIYWAFKLSFRDSERREIIEVSDHKVTVTRLAPHLPTEQIELMRTFVRVDLEEDHDRELIGRLILSERGRVCEIGGFLGPADRKEFSSVLKAAVYGFGR